MTCLCACLVRLIRLDRVGHDNTNACDNTSTSVQAIIAPFKLAVVFVAICDKTCQNSVTIQIVQRVRHVPDMSNARVYQTFNFIAMVVANHVLCQVVMSVRDSCLSVLPDWTESIRPSYQTGPDLDDQVDDQDQCLLCLQCLSIAFLINRIACYGPDPSNF